MERVDEISADAELARAALSGDRQACATLVDRHMGLVFGVILRVVGNKADAEDLTQDTFVRAFERLEQYRSAHPFRNWLLKIATNLAINHVRSRKRERGRYPRIAEQHTERERGLQEVRDVPGPTEWQRWLAQLDESQRAAIVLFHFQEMSYNEVADVLDVPLNTVRTFLHRGRRRLRELMTTHPLPENEPWNVAILNG